MDIEANDGRTLRKELLEEFKEQYGTGDVDCTAMKVSWLSRRSLQKKVGSLVIWLRNKMTVDHLLRTGSVLFGATGVYCSRFERADNNGPCYDCNAHVQQVGYVVANTTAGSGAAAQTAATATATDGATTTGTATTTATTGDATTMTTAL
ncbi:hypothetical protein LTR28_008070 [Elasticomyces elasticus]|nr:hypothetical protein LTR28_008070 [Elasticomyces elasticus]